MIFISKLIQARTCSPRGNECYSKYISENKESLSSSCLKSCHGLYGDIQHITQDEYEIISQNGEPTQGMFEEYLDYKRGFEANYKNYFSNITESRGSTFLGQFVTRDVVSCFNRLNGLNSDCMNDIKIGIRECGGFYECKYGTLELSLIHI